MERQDQAGRRKFRWWVDGMLGVGGVGVADCGGVWIRCFRLKGGEVEERKMGMEMEMGWR